MAFGFAVRAPQWAVTPAAGITLLARLNALRRPELQEVDRMVVLAELWAAAADQGDLLMVKDYLEGDFEGPLATPHGVDDKTHDGWTLLLCASGGDGTHGDDTVVTAGHVAVARYLISRGAGARRARDSPPYTGQLRHLVTLRKWFHSSSPRARRRQ